MNELASSVCLGKVIEKRLGPNISLMEYIGSIENEFENEDSFSKSYIWIG
jgi:hypothetical protein